MLDHQSEAGEQKSSYDLPPCRSLSSETQWDSVSSGERNPSGCLQRSPWILDEQQVVGEEVQRLNLEVAVEEVLQVLQVEEELQVGEVLHAHCLLMQVPASLEDQQVFVVEQLL